MSQYDKVISIVKGLKKGLKTSCISENQLSQRLSEILLELESQEVKDDSLLAFMQKALENQSDILSRIAKIENGIKNNRNMIDEINDRMDKYTDLLVSLFKKRTLREK